jgi:hypothetical protein
MVIVCGFLLAFPRIHMKFSALDETTISTLLKVAEFPFSSIIFLFG